MLLPSLLAPAFDEEMLEILNVDSDTRLCQDPHRSQNSGGQ